MSLLRKSFHVCVPSGSNFPVIFTQVNVSTADELGIQLKYVSDTSEVVIASVSKGSNAQVLSYTVIRWGLISILVNILYQPRFKQH